jgi:hypothetical protein
MAITINGTTGIAGVDGSASTPAVQGTDTNTGLFFGADTISFSEGGTQVGEFDSSANFKFNSGYGSVVTAYGCRAWVNFNGTGTPAIRASGNVSSITDNGTGNYTVNFTTAMPDANYSASGMASDVGGTGNAGLVSLYIGVTAPSTSSFRIFTFIGTTQTDNSYVYVSVFR